MNQHIPRKRFGQNFLEDRRVITAIIDAVNPHYNDTVVEIGPGLGALTRPLVSRLAHLHVIEIDRDIIEKLKKNFSTDPLTIHQGDALTFDFSLFCAPLKVVGNLPYNISTPLLFRLAELGSQVVDMHFMLQKEVVDRMLAKPATADYGRLTVMLQYRFEMEMILFVSPDAFWPPPKVNSAVIRMIPMHGRCGVVYDEAKFGLVVAQAFSQRRKTLRNNLKGLLNEEGLINLGIDPNSRAENLTVEQYVAIANFLNN